jgi:Cdc6-like AAA superfamily ATPase
MATLVEQFKRLEILVTATAKGTFPGVILCGPPGWGKTYTIKTILKKLDVEPARITVNNDHAFVQALDLYKDAPVILLDDTDQLATRSGVHPV